MKGSAATVVPSENPAFSDQLKDICADGVDMYFDMVAGDISDGVFPLMNNRGRIAQIGTASVASWTVPPLAPRRERLILIKELRHQGCIVNNHSDLFPDAWALLGKLIGTGELKHREDIFDGIESAPDALMSLYAGSNTGKTLVRLL
ncbi:MAG: zinc-binding dehydrogenase [Pseudomonadota bacterium]